MDHVNLMIEYGIPSGPGAESAHDFSVVSSSLSVIGVIIFDLLYRDQKVDIMLNKKIALYHLNHLT